MRLYVVTVPPRCNARARGVAKRSFCFAAPSLLSFPLRSFLALFIQEWPYVSSRRGMRMLNVRLAVLFPLWRTFNKTHMRMHSDAKRVSKIMIQFRYVSLFTVLFSLGFTIHLPEVLLVGYSHAHRLINIPARLRLPQTWSISNRVTTAAFHPEPLPS